MKHKLITLIIVVSAGLAHAADPSTNPKSVVYPQDGVWKPIAAVLGGAKLPQPALDAITLRVSGTEFPKEFKAPKGTMFYLVGYRRQTDAPPAALNPK